MPRTYVAPKKRALARAFGSPIRFSFNEVTDTL